MLPYQVEPDVCSQDLILFILNRNHMIVDEISYGCHCLSLLLSKNRNGDGRLEINIGDRDHTFIASASEPLLSVMGMKKEISRCRTWDRTEETK